METRANYIAVGIMTLVAIVAAFLLILWIGGYQSPANTTSLDVRIQGSVSGLGVGSEVQFNGIRVGRVAGLRLDAKDPRFVIARTEIRSDIPVRKDTRASIGVRGLSGGAFIQLEGGSLKSPALFDPGRTGTDIPSIDGDPSTLNDIMARVNAIAVRTEQVMDGLESLVDENSKGISTVVENAEKFSQALADNSDGVDDFLGSAEKLAKSVEELSTKLDATITRAEEIVNAVEPAKITKTVDDISAAAASARELVGTVDQEAVKNLVANLNEASEKAKTLLNSIDTERVNTAVNEFAGAAEKISKAIEPEKISKTVDDISAVATSARELIETVDKETLKSLVADLGEASQKVTSLLNAVDAERVNKAMDQFAGAAEGAQQVVADVSKVTSKFGNRAEDIDQIVTDASQLAARLNKASERVDGVLNKFDGLLGSSDTNGLIAEARETMAEFRKAAKSLDTRIAGVAKGINKFTDRGLADTQSLIRDARRSLQKIDRAMSSFSSNPAGLLTGSTGGGIRESGGGRPRR